jgi:hypothetical protein
MAIQNSWNSDYPQNDGEFLIYDSNAERPVANTLSSGTNITVTNSPGDIQLDFTPVLNDGELIIGDTSGTFQKNTITGGAGINVINGNGTIELEASLEETWVDVTTASQTIVPGENYVANNASLITFTLPTTCAFGTKFTITGLGAGLWEIAQNTGQTIHFGNKSSTAGTGGSLASRKQYDTVTLVCVVADNEFNVISSIGNLDIT